MTMSPRIDVDDLRHRVRGVYQKVAREPAAEFHFETGRALAEKLGYPAAQLDRIPREALDSFAGVGYAFDLATLRPGEHVLDLGSGSGTDAFLAALAVGDQGSVVGVDMTDEQLDKAESLRARHGFGNVRFVHAYLEDLPFEPERFDAIISNGVINLAAEKETVFREAARVLAPGGRMAFSDIVTESQLPDDVVCDASLWAACIGGAAQQDDYRDLIEAAGLRVLTLRVNDRYGFLSKSARSASERYGVKSVSLAVEKPD
jgi:arsenite methyltransferase